MQLSETQASIVNRGKFEQRWEAIDVPTNVTKDDLPPWLLGMQIDWSEEYSNWPSINFHVTEEAHKFDIPYTFDPTKNVYTCIHPDGRARFEYHRACSWEDVEIFDGYAKDDAGKPIWNQRLTHLERRLVTPKSEGYGGREFEILLATAEHPEGEKAYLRGPWRGSPLPGFVETYFYDKGFKSTGTFGVDCSEELVLKALAYFHPHLRAARVWRYTSDRGHFEPCVDGYAPKLFPGGALLTKTNTLVLT